MVASYGIHTDIMMLPVHSQNAKDAGGGGGAVTTSMKWIGDDSLHVQHILCSYTGISAGLYA